MYRRIEEHKNKVTKGFSSNYNINKLVYYEVGDTIESVIIREKQIKSWKREQKVKRIN